MINNEYRCNNTIGLIMKTPQSIAGVFNNQFLKLCLVLGFVVISGCKNGNDKFVKFNSVDQLKIGDFVYLLDSNIGQVKRIELIDLTPIVTIEISTNYKFCMTDSISIKAVGLMGERKISIKPSLKCLEFYLNDTLIGFNQIEVDNDVKTVVNLLTNLKTTQDSMNSQPDNPWMPQDVRNFLERSKDCNHWGGEDGYDAERRAEIEKATTELHCLSLDSEKIILLKNHENSPQIIDSIKAADTLTW